MAMASRDNDRQTICFFLATYFRQAHWSSCSWFFAYLLYGVYFFPPFWPGLFQFFWFHFHSMWLHFFFKPTRVGRFFWMGRLIGIGGCYIDHLGSQGPVAPPQTVKEQKRKEEERLGVPERFFWGFWASVLASSLVGGNAGKAQP